MICFSGGGDLCIYLSLVQLVPSRRIVRDKTLLRKAKRSERGKRLRMDGEELTFPSPHLTFFPTSPSNTQPASQPILLLKPNLVPFFLLRLLLELRFASLLHGSSSEVDESFGSVVHVQDGSVFLQGKAKRKEGRGFTLVGKERERGREGGYGEREKEKERKR